MTRMMDLSGRCVLVTGSTGTIGRAIAQGLAEAGAAVLCHYRSAEADAGKLAVELGNGAEAVFGDLSDPSGVRKFVNELVGSGLQPDSLVNNAADQSIADMIDLDIADWQAMLRTNLDSVFQLSQWLVQHCRDRNADGAIVNISSIEGTDPAPGHGHYATSKAALNMLTRSLAQEAGGDNIRVNTIAPGLIRRDGIEEAWPEGVARWRERAPLSRLGEGVDIANAVVFLLSDAASWVSGAHLVVDGGMSAQTRW